MIIGFIIHEVKTTFIIIKVLNFRLSTLTSSILCPAGNVCSITFPDVRLFNFVLINAFLFLVLRAKTPPLSIYHSLSLCTKPFLISDVLAMYIKILISIIPNEVHTTQVNPPPNALLIQLCRLSSAFFVIIKTKWQGACCQWYCHIYVCLS